MEKRIGLVAGSLLLALTGCVPLLVGAAISQNQNERMAALLEESKGADPAHAGVTGLVIDQSGTVLDTLSNSPAREAKIKVGDRILEIDGVPFAPAMLPLSGAPDTQVRLLLLHPLVHDEHEQREVIVTRVRWRSLLEDEQPATSPRSGP